MTSRGTALLLATPRPDTVSTGPGKMPRSSEDSGVTRTVHGQRFDVVRTTARGWFGQEPASIRSVILVPWGVAASCERTIWTGTARWQTRGDTAFYVAQPRPRESWVDGVPVLDLVPGLDEWHGDGATWGLMFGPPPASIRWNSPAELFEVYARMPPVEATHAGNLDSLVPFRRWAERNPDIFAKAPADSRIDEVEGTILDHRARLDSVPYRGTYEVTITLPSGRVLRQYWRTGEKPPMAWPVQIREPGWPPPGRGIDLHFAMSSTLDSLPDSAYQEGRAHATWLLWVGVPVGSGERRWPFGLEAQEFEGLIKREPELAGVLTRKPTPLIPPLSRDTRETPGVFAVTSNGEATLRMEWDLDGDGRADIVLAGRRVSMVGIRRE